MSRTHNPEHFNAGAESLLPGLMGLVITAVSPQEVQAEMEVQQQVMALNGFLHAGSLVTLADTCCAYGCLASLPDGAASFTTLELKSNHLGTAREGTVQCVATPAHQGRSTQVWDAVIHHKETGRKLAIFRCTQMILYP